MHIDSITIRMENFMAEGRRGKTSSQETTESPMGLSSHRSFGRLVGLQTNWSCRNENLLERILYAPRFNQNRSPRATCRNCCIDTPALTHGVLSQFKLRLSKIFLTLQAHVISDRLLIYSYRRNEKSSRPYTISSPVDLFKKRKFRLQSLRCV